jgi:hypothetical protein
VRPRADRNAFLVFTALVWAGVLSGFGTDSFNHVRRHGLDYPLIVHCHAVAFVGWLVLFTVQVTLIRNARPDLHRRLGMAAVALAAVMVILGPATALFVDAARFSATGRTPEFLAVQLTDILAFAGLTGCGLLLREVPAAHKPLMRWGSSTSAMQASPASSTASRRHPRSDSLGRDRRPLPGERPSARARCL